MLLVFLKGSPIFGIEFWSPSSRGIVCALDVYLGLVNLDREFEWFAGDFLYCWLTFISIVVFEEFGDRCCVVVNDLSCGGLDLWECGTLILVRGFRSDGGILI